MSISEWKRYDGETDEELIYRISSHKDEIGSWKDVADILNSLLGKDYNESTYRKRYQYFEKVFNENQSKFYEEESLLEEIRLQKRELEKARKKLSDEKIDYNKTIREEARKESYADMIKDIICKNVEPIELSINNIFKDYNSDNDLLVHITDIHTGIEIDNFKNCFNQDILKDRIERYTSKIIQIANKHNSENCYIVIGEIISGIIHNNLRLQNNMDMMEQFKYISELISVMLTELKDYFKEIHVYVTMGNHSRLVAKKEDSLAGENMDLLLPFYLKARLQNSTNIYIHNNDIEQSIAMFNIRGNNIFAVHGDKDSPKNVVQNFTMMFGIKPQIVLLGHRHANGMTTVYDTKVIESGCVSGSDEYALSIRKVTKPEQTVSIIDNNGLVCLYDIQLD